MISDAQIRGRLLETFHGLRHNNNGWVPVSDINLSPDAVPNHVVRGVCQQLADVGLIQWQSYHDGGASVGTGKITGKGVAAVEARRCNEIDIQFSADAAKAGEQISEDGRRNRFERWEKIGLDRVKADLLHGGHQVVGGSTQVKDLAWEWVRLQENNQGKGAKAMSSNAKVFIVHGHDNEAKSEVARLLQRLGLEPIILHEQANRGRTIIEKIEGHGEVGFAVILLTPDDEGRKKGDAEFKARARQNVVLELGYFVGRIGRDRVCALKRGDVEVPSDFDGVVYEPFDSHGAWKSKLAKELEAAGFSIDWVKVHE